MSSRQRTGLRADKVGRIAKALDLLCGRADPRASQHREEALQSAAAES